MYAHIRTLDVSSNALKSLRPIADVLRSSASHKYVQQLNLEGNIIGAWPNEGLRLINMQHVGLCAERLFSSAAFLCVAQR